MTRRWLVNALLLAALVVVGVVVWQQELLRRMRLEELVADAGLWGPVVFVVVYAVLSLFPVPQGLFTVLAGVLFGAVGGVLVVWVAAVLGALGGFLIARSSLRPAIDPIIRRYRGDVRERLVGTGVLPILAIRLMPVAPFMAVNYVCGAAGVPLRPYSIATMLGILPAVIVYVQVGASGLQDPAGLLWGLAGIVLLILLGGWLLRRTDRTRQAGSSQESGSVLES